MRNGIESCDGTDLGGQTCASLGFGGGMLACTGTGQDEDIQAGAALSYTDNGDGTITDNTTGLSRPRAAPASRATRGT